MPLCSEKRDSNDCGNYKANYVALVTDLFHRWFRCLQTRLGLGVSTKKFHLNALYNLKIWISYYYFYYYIAVTFKVGKLFLKVSYIINLLSTILITVVSVIMNSYQDKVYPAILNDEELKKSLNNSFTFERVQMLKKKRYIFVNQ